MIWRTNKLKKSCWKVAERAAEDSGESPVVSRLLSFCPVSCPTWEANDNKPTGFLNIKWPEQDAVIKSISQRKTVNPEGRNRWGQREETDEDKGLGRRKTFKLKKAKWSHKLPLWKKGPNGSQSSWIYKDLPRKWNVMFNSTCLRAN